ASGTLCEVVKKGEKGTFTTIRTARRLPAAKSLASSQGELAQLLADLLGLRDVHLVVRSLTRPPGQTGAAVTSLSSSPRASRISHGPMLGPKLRTSSSGSASATLANVGSLERGASGPSWHRSPKERPRGG